MKKLNYSFYNLHNTTLPTYSLVLQQLFLPMIQNWTEQIDVFVWCRFSLHYASWMRLLIALHARSNLACNLERAVQRNVHQCLIAWGAKRTAAPMRKCCLFFIQDGLLLHATLASRWSIPIEMPSNQKSPQYFVSVTAINVRCHLNFVFSSKSCFIFCDMVLPNEIPPKS